MAPLILKHQGNGTMSAVLLGPKDPPQKIQVGNYTLEVAADSMPGRCPAQPPQALLGGNLHRDRARRVLRRRQRRERHVFSKHAGTRVAGLGTVEEGAFVNGRWIPSRQLAGDETGQGQNLSLRNHPGSNPGRYVGIQRFTLYRYR